MKTVTSEGFHFQKTFDKLSEKLIYFFHTDLFYMPFCLKYCYPLTCFSLTCFPITVISLFMVFSAVCWMRGEGCRDRREAGVGRCKCAFWQHPPADLQEPGTKGAEPNLVGGLQGLWSPGILHLQENFSPLGLRFSLDNKEEGETI